MSADKTRKLLYLHGFNSTSQSHKARVLQTYLANRGDAAQLIAPDLPHRPAQAMALLEAIITPMTSKPCVAGSSLGGYYATYLAERFDLKAVLINPAIAPYHLLAPLLGQQQNYHSGEQYEFTSQHLAELRALEVTTLHPERYFVLLQTGDEVLDYREAQVRYAGAKQTVIPGGDHSFQNFEDHLSDILAFSGIGSGTR